MSYALPKTTLFGDLHLESEEPVYKVSGGCQGQNVDHYDYENTTQGYFGEVKINKESVSIGVFEQVKWERDVALEQLKELGYGLGEKIRTDEDCISREELLLYLDKLKESEHKHYGFILSLQRYLCDLPSVKPKERIGHWVSAGGMYFICSECGEPAAMVDVPIKKAKVPYLTEWCPKCGARMIESEDKK